jgi:parallel beta-helix repeat protein
MKYWYLHMYILMQMDGMKKVVICLIASFVLMHSYMFSSTVDVYCRADSVLPKFYVDDDYNSTIPGWQVDHFNVIQDAIDASETGDRIIVYEGVYYETIVIDKSIDIFGEDYVSTIIDGEENGSVVTITASSVDFSTFTVTNGGVNETDALIKVASTAGGCKIIENNLNDGIYGIYVSGCNNNVVEQNIITDTNNATFFISSNLNRIAYNTIYENNDNGIFLNRSCEDNTITHNEIYDNLNNGLYLNDICVDNSITENTIHGNGNTGIRIEDDSSRNTVSSNTIYENENYGIMIVGSSNRITSNTVRENVKYGIFLFADDNSTVSENIVTSNILDGIRLQNSTDDSVTKNRILDNERHGMYVNYYSINLLIYNNYFSGNTINAKDVSPEDSENQWYTTLTQLSNIIYGPFIGGNYWDDYNGTDSDRDGIGDSSYNISGGDKTDEYPLLHLQPVAAAGGPYEGSVFETISFDGSESYDVNESMNLTYSWIFSDGTHKSGEIVRHHFEEAGNFSIRLTVENELGGSDTDTTYVIVTPDLTPPIITIETIKLAYSESSTLFTIRAEVTDNVDVVNVSIEYWYNNQTDHMITIMNEKSTDVYEKTIISKELVEQIYCIIYAEDTSGNMNDTMSPFASISVKNQANVSETISFDGSESFDLDGTIMNYTWDFGDGVILEGELIDHAYASDGTYTVVLTVTDDEGNTGRSTETVTVIPPVPIIASNDTLELINTHGSFSIDLSEAFYCYDTNGDGLPDMFVDPNRELTQVGSAVVIDDDVVFLISIDDSVIPEFMWEPETDRISWISYVQKSVSEENSQIDYTLEKATISVSVDKSGWIFLDIPDTLYPNAVLLEVKAGNNPVPDTQIWRKDGHIYVLDDPATTYSFVFEDIFPPVEASFSPGDSGLINEDSQTVTISYNVPVTIRYAVFETTRVESELVKIDDQTYNYTPPGYWPNGTYTFHIEAEAVYGSSSDAASATYFYFQYMQPPQPSFIETYGLVLVLAGIIIAGGLLYLVCRYKGLKFDSYIYIKNRRIIPFFKPIVFGPMSVTIDSANVSKAEFYIDGVLKETVSKEPYVWQWNESAYRTHNVEAKVFDGKGKKIGSDAMSVFVVNPFAWNPSPVEEIEKE